MHAHRAGHHPHKHTTYAAMKLIGSDFDMVATLAYLKNSSTLYSNANVNGAALKHLVQEVVVPNCDCFTMMTGGLDSGDLLALFTEACLGIFAIGFEIRRRAFQNNLARFANNSNVHIVNCGMSNTETETTVFGDNALAGIGHVGQWATQARATEGEYREKDAHKVSTVPLSTFARDLERVDLLTIDAEGHESSIIAGMALHEEASRRRFAAFQFELGGTWSDSRHPSGSWSLQKTMGYLDDWGYRIYIVGNTLGAIPTYSEWGQTGNFAGAETDHPAKATFLWLNSSIFARSPCADACRGDALALHPAFAHHDLTAFDDAHTVAFRLSDQSTTWRGRGHLLRSE